MIKIIGLTGGIGSGKSFIAKEFEKKHISVYYSDDVAKTIMKQADVILQVNQLFNDLVLLENGELDRVKIRELVFNNDEKLNQLNQIIHPKVYQHFKDWLEKHKNEKFVVKESALLYETKAHLNCWKTILVEANLQKRIEMVQKRDHVSAENVKQIIDKQMSDIEKKKLADFVIFNDFTQQTLKLFNELFEKINNSL